MSYPNKLHAGDLDDVAAPSPDELREPRVGVHEDGTEELKSWDTLYAQCLAAADARDHDNYAHAVEVAARDLRIEALGKRLEAAEKALAEIRLVSSGPYHLFILDWWTKFRWIHDWANAALAGRKP